MSGMFVWKACCLCGFSADGDVKRILRDLVTADLALVLGHHKTIVVGRHGMFGVECLFDGGVSDQLLRDARGFAIWVAE